MLMTANALRSGTRNGEHRLRRKCIVAWDEANKDAGQCQNCAQTITCLTLPAPFRHGDYDGDAFLQAISARTAYLCLYLSHEARATTLGKTNKFDNPCALSRRRLAQRERMRHHGTIKNIQDHRRQASKQWQSNRAVWLVRAV